LGKDDGLIGKPGHMFRVILSLTSTSFLVKYVSLFAFALLLISTSCNSTKQTTETAAATEKARTNERPQRGGERPTPEAMFAQMDTNKDGKITKAEAKGPLANDFARIDADENGFISLEEMKAAAPTGNRPPRSGGRPGGGA